MTASWIGSRQLRGREGKQTLAYILQECAAQHLLSPSSLCLFVTMLHPKQFFHAHPAVLCGYKEMAAKHAEVVGMNKTSQTALD